MAAQRIREIAGFVVSPPMPALIAAVCIAPFAPEKFGEFAWLIGLAAILGYPIAAIFGLPLYLLLRSRNWNGLLSYVAAGAVLGIVLFACYGVIYERDSAGMLFLSGHFWSMAPAFVPVGAICGMVAATTFWLIVRPDRPRP